MGIFKKLINASIFSLALVGTGATNAAVLTGGGGALDFTDGVTSFGQSYRDDTGTHGIGVDVGDTFADEWTFTLDLPSSVDGSVTDSKYFHVIFQTGFNGDITDFMVSLDGGSSFAVSDNLAEINLDNLAAGPHTLLVSGTINHRKGGEYSGELSVNAVPIPAAAYMFGSVLCSLAVFGRKRKMATAA